MVILRHGTASNPELSTDVLDSLSGHIAVVDSQGTIIAVNRAWENFAAENGGGSATSRTGVGASCLAVCERAALEPDPDGTVVLEGLRGVLSGSRKSSVHEYSCHSLMEERWFLMEISPLLGPGGGAVVVHRNTTPQKFAEFGLRSEARSEANRLQQIVDVHASKIKDIQMAMILALAKLAESRDRETGQHLERVRAFCCLLAAGLSKLPGLSVKLDSAWIRNFMNASHLHDIGKVGIPDAVLLKPGPLTPEERAIMQAHPAIGAETLMAVTQRHPGNDFIEVGIELTWSHHERWDGKGYPRGLAGTEIPLSARILSVADTYDSIRSKRVYKEVQSHERAAEIIRAERGKQFDPDVVDVFLGIEDRIREEFDRNNDSSPE